MRVCQYLSNCHPFYLRMVANSMTMLRQHNATVKVRLILIQDGGVITKTTNHRGDSLSTASKYTTSDYIKFFQDLNAEVIEREPLQEYFFHIHRSLLQYTQEESLLFIDADTFIFRDVEQLFDKYKEYDYVGLPIVHIHGWNKEWLPFRPYNSAVNLWNNGWIRKFGKALPDYCAKLSEQSDDIGKWCYQQCVRGTNREEISTSMFVAENEINHTAWHLDDVRNSATLNDYDEAPNTYIFHTFTHNWNRARGMFCQRRKRIRPVFIGSK